MHTVRRGLVGTLAMALVLGVGLVGGTAAFAQGKAAGAKKTDTAAETKDAAGVVAAEFKAFSELATAAGIGDTLKGAGPLTVFVPTDEAVAALPKETLETLKKDPAALKAVLLNHIAPVSIGPKALPTSGTIKTLGTMELTAKAADDKSVLALVNDAKVLKRVAASNGRIYSIDKVILPPAGK